MTDKVIFESANLRGKYPYVVQRLYYPRWVDYSLYGIAREARQELERLVREMPSYEYRVVRRTEDSDDR